MSVDVLGIPNRTENHKTAEYFSKYFLSKDKRLEFATRLAKGDGRLSADGTLEGEVTLELFWKGVRDYRYANKKDLNLNEYLWKAYCEECRNLKEEVKEWTKPAKANGLDPLQDDNYRIDDPDGSVQIRVLNNLSNTEIDVVLAAPGWLFVGEAKFKSDFGAKGDTVLVHQLIRQGVAVRVLVREMQRAKRLGEIKIVHFLMLDEDKIEGAKSKGQVDFMIKKKQWLKEENILPW